MTPPPLVRIRLTGNARLRHGFLGRLVLQVQVEHVSYEPWKPDRRRQRQTGPETWEDIPPWYTWRNAKAEDVLIGPAFVVPTVESVASLWPTGAPER
jgi:hypothetical protein